MRKPIKGSKHSDYSLVFTKYFSQKIGIATQGLVAWTKNA